MKNLKKPTEAQIKYRNRLWAKALLENKKKARKRMCNLAGGACCLMVAERVARENGLSVRKSTVTTKTPKGSVAAFFGWEGVNPLLAIPSKSMERASSVNDYLYYNKKHNGLPHRLIAECVLNTFVHPAKKKWSFKL